VYAAQAPGTGATTIDTAGNSTNGVLSLSCSGAPATITLNYITNGDVVSEIQTSILDEGTASGKENDDPEGAIPLVPDPTSAKDDGLLVAAITGGTADGGNGTQVTYNLTTEGSGAGGDTPDAPPSGCLVGGTKVFS
jgi:hypothetical protein